MRIYNENSYFGVDDVNDFKNAANEIATRIGWSHRVISTVFTANYVPGLITGTYELEDILQLIRDEVGHVLPLAGTYFNAQTTSLTSFSSIGGTALLASQDQSDAPNLESLPKTFEYFTYDGANKVARALEKMLEITGVN